MTRAAKKKCEQTNVVAKAKSLPERQRQLRTVIVFILVCSFRSSSGHVHGRSPQRAASILRGRLDRFWKDKRLGSKGSCRGQKESRENAKSELHYPLQYLRCVKLMTKTNGIRLWRFLLAAVDVDRRTRHFGLFRRRRRRCERRSRVWHTASFAPTPHFLFLVLPRGRSVVKIFLSLFLLERSYPK